MEFNDILNEYIEKIGCTAKELSDKSGISTATLSRYRSGERIPKYNSSQLESLINSLDSLAKEKNISLDIKKQLEASLTYMDIDFDVFRNNLNTLITSLDINVSKMSKYIGFDSSYISKIRSGSRKPQDISIVTNSICKYITNYYDDFKSKEVIVTLLNCKNNDIKEKKDYNDLLYKWLINNVKKEETNINNFLAKLDEFNLDEYIKSIKFDKIKVITTPFQIPKSKFYYGIEGFKNSQIDTLKSIVLSKSMEDVFFYSNMSMIEASKDLEFTKKFMIGLAFMLKKGLHLNMIHDLDRPFRELMLGLEGWIPLYMTGQISPYYFQDNSNKIFSQLNCVSGNIVLSGSCVTGHIDKSKFHLTNKTEDVEYAKANAKILLKKANSLMDIYRENRKEEFIKILDNNTNINSKRKNILTSLPLYTISDELLNKLIVSNKIGNDKNKIIKAINNEKERINKILEENEIFDEIMVLSKEEFDKYGYHLSLPNIFYDKKILYTYEDYLEHIKLIKKFKKENKNYNYSINDNSIFKNINIHILENKQVIISKENSPTIHFVINHPTLINAIENFDSNMPKDYTN